MQKKKSKKPLFYKKSKAAREDETHGRLLEFDDYRDKSHKHSPSRKKTSKYIREYEHSDYDDGYGRDQYIYHYGNGMEDLDNDMIEYTTEESSRYRRSPERVREYEMETQYSHESDSECFTCNSRRHQRSDYTSEYPAEYFREERRAPRHKIYRQSMKKKKRIMPSETETVRSPYRQNINIRNGGRRFYREEIEDEADDGSPYRYYEAAGRENPYHRNHQEVYLARAPVGQEAFRYQEQQDIDEQSSNSGSETYSERDYKRHDKMIKVPKKKKNQSQYQIFAANIEENKGLFQSQQGQNKREKLLTVTEYEEAVAQKNTIMIKSQDENQPIVYLPVVVMDNSIKLPDSKVIPTETILRSIGDMAEKPLETNNNMNIYLAAEDGQGNIFEKAQRNATQEPMMPDTTKINTVPSNSNTINKNQSMISKLTSKMRSKSKSDYPVQKSYINVAPTKSKLAEKKGSQTSVKSGASKTSKSSNKSGGSKISVTSSLLGSDKPNSPKGSGYYSVIHNKDIKVKKLRKKKDKNKNDDSGSVLMSVVDLTGDKTKDTKTKSIVSQKSDFQKQSNIQRSASQVLKRTPMSNMKSESRENITKQQTSDRPVSFVKQPSMVRQPSASKDSKIITIKDVNKGVFEESTNFFEQSEADIQQPTSPQSGNTLQKKKSFGSSIFQRKGKKQKPDLSSKSTPEELNPYEFDSDHQNSPTSGMKLVQRQKSQEDSQKVKKSASSKHLKSKKSKVDVSKKTEEFQFLNVMGLNSSVLVCIFQVVQYFLGLSTHGTLMEILRTFKHSD